MSGASLPSWARKGVRVICVKAVTTTRNGAPLGTGDEPVVGRTYTVTWAGYSADLLPCVDVDASRTGDWCYDVEHFRPAVEPKTQEQDVAEFRKLLTQKLPEAV